MRKNNCKRAGALALPTMMLADGQRRRAACMGGNVRLVATTWE